MSLTKNIMDDVVVSYSLPKLIDSFNNSFTMGIMKTRSKLDRFNYVSIFVRIFYSSRVRFFLFSLFLFFFFFL